MKFIATSVVRGSRQGESHGGVYLIDSETEKREQVIDWNTMDIDWQGRGWDRGFRIESLRIGIELHSYFESAKRATSTVSKV